MDELNKIIDRYTDGNYLIGKTAKEEMAKDILALFSVVGRSEQLKIPKTTKEQRVQLNEGYNRN